jgi:hypothetical protein
VVVAQGLVLSLASIVSDLVVVDLVVVGGSSSYLRGRAVDKYCEVRVFGRDQSYFLSGCLLGDWAAVVVDGKMIV